MKNFAEHPLIPISDLSILNKTKKNDKVCQDKYLMLFDTIKSEIFARILFLWIALKDIFVTLKIRD